MAPAGARGGVQHPACACRCPSGCIFESRRRSTHRPFLLIYRRRDRCFHSWLCGALPRHCHCSVRTERRGALRSIIGFPFLPSSSYVDSDGETPRTSANAHIPPGALRLLSPHVGDRNRSRRRRGFAFAPLAKHPCDRAFGFPLETILPIGKTDSVTPGPTAFELVAT